MDANQRGHAMRLADEWRNRPSADDKPAKVTAIGNQMAELLRQLATEYPVRKPAMWVHQDNPQITTQREPLGPGWVALYREER